MSLKKITPRAGDTFRLLVSVTDKTGLEKLGRLTSCGAQIISTGGTATALKDLHGITCTEVSKVTNFPEILGGRLKIIHPKIFGGLLANQNDPDHMQTIAMHGIEPFHAVFVNLYEFAKKPAISEIDVGGPSALRAAAKAGLIVVVEPEDYDRVIDAILESEDGSIPPRLQLELACKVFQHTAIYDQAIYEWFESQYIDGVNPYGDTSAAH